MQSNYDLLVSACVGMVHCWYSNDSEMH